MYWNLNATRWKYIIHQEHLALVIELSVGFYWNVKNSEFQRYLLWVPETKECYF